MASVSDVIYSLTQVLIGQHRYQEALLFLNENYKKYPPQNLSEKRNMTGLLGDCYLKLKKYSQAEGYFLKEFAMHEDHESPGEYRYHRMAFFYIETRNYAKAKAYLAIALKKLAPTVSTQTKGHLYFMCFLADSAMHNYREAMYYLRGNKRFDDTIYEQSKVREIQKLVVQYETDKKNEQIKDFEQNQKVQKARLVQADFIRNLTIIAIIVLLLLFFFLFKQYNRNKWSAGVISQKNKQLENLLIEKEWLLKEVHHRVKNNLHTVICLLELQAEFLQDEALSALESSQHRIYAMSLIHQKLYLSDDTRLIKIAEYVKELITYLDQSFGDLKNITYQYDIESLQLDISIAIPLGLIINEAVSNSIKHAFPDKMEGQVSLSLHKIADEILVTIADNGIGLITENHAASERSLGLKLIRGLSEDINAEIHFESNEGTHIFISFPGNVL